MIEHRLTRRGFLAVAAGAGALSAVPLGLESLFVSARAAAPEGPGYFLNHERWRTCAALCARVVPTGADPVVEPGATEAHAVVFIDRFLSAFELPAAVADHPAIHLRGRFSGRNPRAGEPPVQAGDFLSVDGSGAVQAHFLALDAHQTASFRALLYGSAALAAAPVSPRWRAQVGTLIPAPPGLRDLYGSGLDSFDSYSRSSFGVPFADASTGDQDLMIAVAGNPVLGAFPVPLPAPPDPPAPAQALLPVVTLHTFQACYGLPEYSWRNQDDDDGIFPGGGTPSWRAIGFEGDTQPLGNSVYDPALAGPGEGPNAGFGDPAVFLPRGGYREHRAVSTLEPGGSELTDADVAPIVAALRRRGAVTHRAAPHRRVRS